MTVFASALLILEEGIVGHYVFIHPWCFWSICGMYRSV